MGTVRSVYGCFRLPISGIPFSLNLLSRNSSLGCSLRCVHEASDCMSFARKRRGWRLEGEWDRRNCSRESEDPTKSVNRPKFPAAHDWLRAGKRAMCVSSGQQIVRLEEGHI